MQGGKRVKADLTQPPNVTGVESGEGEGLDISGRSDDSTLDPCYALPTVLPSDSESDPGEGSSTSRPKSTNKWRAASKWKLRVVPPKSLKQRRSATKVS